MNGLRVIHGVIHSIALDLSIRLFRLFPAHHHSVLGYNLCLDVPRWASRGLFACSSLYRLTGGTLADCVDGRDADLILGVRVEAADAVACGGDVIHRLVLAVWGLGAVLDNVVSDRVRVARVPGDGDAGGSGFGDYGRARGLGQSCEETGRKI